MRVLVCGGRDFTDRRFLGDVLDGLHGKFGFTVLIHGAARGADTMAGDWATERGLEVESYPADWEHLGRAAGPVRNKRMLVVGAPELVVAFPHPSWTASRGTKDMVKQAKAAGLRCLVMM